MTGGTTDVLSPDSVIAVATKALPHDASLKTPYEAVALIGHSCMVAVGFRLLGLGEDHSIRSCLSISAYTFSS